MAVISEQFEELYHNLGGTGRCTRERLYLLVCYHVGAVSVRNIQDAGFKSVKHIGSVLHTLTEHGYVECRPCVIPNIFKMCKRSDLYVITKEGRAYVEDSILDSTYLSIHVKRDGDQYTPGNRQFIHNLGMAGFFYSMLPYWDAGSAFYLECPIEHAPMRPDAMYTHTGDTSLDAYTYYVEEDTGVQVYEVIDQKFQNYKKYFENISNPINHVLIFHLNDMRFTEGKCKPTPDIASRLRRIANRYVRIHGEGCRIPAKEIPAGYDVFLPVQQSYSPQELIRASGRYIETRSEFVDRLARETSGAYTERRRSLLLPITWLDDLWQKGLQTLCIPERYTAEYLAYCIPERYTCLSDSLAELGYLQMPPMEAAGYALAFKKSDGTEYHIGARVLYQNAGRYLCVENITHDMSGIYRADLYLKSGVDLLLIAEKKEQITAMLEGYETASSRIYAMLYSDFSENTCTIRDGRTFEVLS